MEWSLPSLPASPLWQATQPAEVVKKGSSARASAAPRSSSRAVKEALIWVIVCRRMALSYQPSKKPPSNQSHSR